MVRAHHHYGENRRQVPGEVAAMVQLVQEADCFSFGLLRQLSAGVMAEEERCRFAEAALRPLGLTERTVPAARLAEMVHDVETETRKAARVINIAYS